MQLEAIPLSIPRGDASGRKDPEQQAILRVLVLAQVLSGAGLSAGITVGALLAQEMLGTTSLAGVPSALFTIGSALAAFSVGRVSQRHGRRPGLAVGYLIGAGGSAAVVAAALLESVPLLFAALFVYGSGTATNLQARYAGADLAPPDRRGRAISTVLVATTLGAVVGPNLVAPMGDVARAVGVPPLAGPFLLATVAYGGAGLVLWLLLRPDPLLLARSRQRSAVHSGVAAHTDGTREPAFVVAASAGVMVVAQLVMVAIMTMTPVHMTAHGHSLSAAGLVIAVHVGAMFLPAPLSGWLVDRLGSRVVAGLAGVTLATAAVMAAAAPVDSTPALGAALAVLGFGWSLGIVSGTTLLSAAVPLERRAQTQGSVDLAIAVAGAGGGLGSGFVVAFSGYQYLAMAGAVAALLIVGVVALTWRRPRLAAVAD